MFDPKNGAVWYSRGIRWPGVIAQMSGTSAALLCSNTPALVGPIATILGGTDLSALTGPAVAAGVYLSIQRSNRQSYLAG